MPERAFRQAIASDWFDLYARFGYASKGVVWGLVGLLAVRVALGEHDEQADFYGALGEIGDQPLNAAFLILLSIAMLGYAAWRIIQAIADVEGEGRGAVGYFKRFLYLTVGLTYGFFGVYSIGILAGWSTDEDNEVRDLTAMALGWPAGEWIVGTVGGLILVAGLAELYVVVSRRFEVELGRDDLGRFERWCLLCSGSYGHAARGIIYSAAGVFAIRSAIDYDPDEARGIAETFRELATQPYGNLIVGAIALGFIAFGAYCILLAFHRHIPNEGLIRGRGDGGSEPKGDPPEAQQA
jgi:hypothetical protein